MELGFSGPILRCACMSLVYCWGVCTLPFNYSGCLTVVITTTTAATTTTTITITTTTTTTATSTLLT